MGDGVFKDPKRFGKNRAATLSKDSEFFTTRTKANNKNDVPYHNSTIPSLDLATTDTTLDNSFDQSQEADTPIDRQTLLHSQYSIESDDVIEDVLVGPLIPTEEKLENLPNPLADLINGFTSKIELVLYMAVFIITNSAQPLLIYLLRQYGGTPNGTYTFLLPTYLAMICIGLYPTKKKIWEESWYYPAFLSLLDVIHQVIEKAGLVLCGPSIYTIGSSTNTMFLALFSNVVLKQEISSTTWTSISLISASIALSGITQLEDITKYHVIGFCLVVFAGMVNSFNSIISEDILKKNEIEGPNLVCMMGCISLSLFLGWTLVWTVPQWDSLFVTPSMLGVIDYSKAINILLTLFVSNLGRSSVYYYIIREAGSVCCGVLKAIRIIIVVIGSHVLLSAFDGTQRITTCKLISTVICSCGVLLYSLEKTGIKKSNKEA